MSESAGAGMPMSAPNTSTPAPQAPQSPAPMTVAERHRVKVEGAELELSIDELKRDYQLKEASNRRFQEASAMAKKAAPILEALEKGDLRKLMESVPKDQFRQFAEEYLIGEIEYEQLPDYEKRRIQAEMRAQELQEELNREREGKNKEQAAREAAEAGHQVDQEISEVLKKMGKQPTPYLVVAILDEMIASFDAKGEKLSADKAFQKSMERLKNQGKSYLDDLPDNEFIEHLSPQRIEAVRKHLMSQVKSTSYQRPQSQQQAPLKREDSKPMSIDEAFAAREAQIKSHRRKA